MREQLANYIENKIEVSQEELETILSYFRPLKLKKNELLLTDGQTSQRTFLLAKVV